MYFSEYSLGDFALPVAHGVNLLQITRTKSSLHILHCVEQYTNMQCIYLFA